MFKKAIVTATFLIFASVDSYAAERFTSPSGRYEFTFTEIEHVKYPSGRVKDINEVSHIAYRIDFFKKKEKTAAASVNFNDVYGWESDGKPTKIKKLASMLVWSPKEDFVILPDEGWASAPGTENSIVVAVSTKLPWKTSEFAFDTFIWIDDLTVIGDSHKDCDYSVTKFDGKTGTAVTVMGSQSPVGYEIVSSNKGRLLIREVLDNCRVEDQPPACFTYDLKTQKKIEIPCPEK